MADRTDARVLTGAVQAVETAGRTLIERFGSRPPPSDLRTLLDGVAANDEAVIPRLRASLLDACPGSRWVDDEEAEGPSPAGDWWLVDPVEGNVNHLHGRPGWGVTATLVRDGEPRLTAIHLPQAAETCVASVGGGAFVAGRPLSVSRKRRLDAAIVSTGQARPGEPPALKARMAGSVAALLDAALLVRVSVPTAMELVDVSAGRLDAFWQHGGTAAGLLGGALLIREAGGVAIDLHGRRWTPAASTFVAGPAPLAQDLAALLVSLCQSE